MAILATKLKPSTTNTEGTVIGTIIGGLTVTYLTQAAWMVGLAGAIGLTPIALAGAAGVGITALVNYAATHIAEVKELDKIAQLIPKTYTEYPKDKNGR